LKIWGGKNPMTQGTGLNKKYRESFGGRKKKPKGHFEMRGALYHNLKREKEGGPNFKRGKGGLGNSWARRELGGVLGL